jgi:hypothetical protein
MDHVAPLPKSRKLKLIDKFRRISKNLGRLFCEAPEIHGRLAQLGERRVRNAEVEGSNPLPSTKAAQQRGKRPIGWPSCSYNSPYQINGRLAQWESACFTRKRSLVQSQQRPL